MADKWFHDLVQTGSLIEGEPAMPGHYETMTTPITCVCCGYVMYFRGKLCVCMQAREWYQNEARQKSCSFHLGEKIKDGLYRT